VPFGLTCHDPGMGTRGRWSRSILPVVMLGAALGGCGDHGEGGGQPRADADGSEAAGTKVELLRAEGDDFDRIVVAHTAEEGRSICISVTQKRGEGGWCNEVSEQALVVDDEPTGGLVYGYVTGHPEVVEVRVAGGGREIVLPLKEKVLRPTPVHKFSGDPIPLRFFAVADRVAHNDYTVTALDGDGRPVEVETTAF
jgi:hypothetical protein